MVYDLGEGRYIALYGLYPYALEVLDRQGSLDWTWTPVALDGYMMRRSLPPPVEHSRVPGHIMTWLKETEREVLGR